MVDIIERKKLRSDLSNIGNSENLGKGKERRLRGGFDDDGAESGALLSRSLFNKVIN